MKLNRKENPSDQGRLANAVRDAKVEAEAGSEFEDPRSRANRVALDDIRQATKTHHSGN